LQPELLLLAQICTKSFVGSGFAPDPTGGVTALPRPPSWFRGWGSRGKGRKEGRGKGGRGGKGGEGVPECRNPELATPSGLGMF